MEIPILIERIEDQQRARMIADEIVPLHMPEGTHPLAEFMGMFKDDPLIEEWKQSMAEYRKSIDDDVMGGEDQHMLFGRKPEQTGAEQRSFRKIEWSTGFGANRLPQLLFPVRRRDEFKRGHGQVD